MSDLISRSDVLKHHWFELAATKEQLIRAIKTAPAVDAVKVVRCEKCKHCLIDLSERNAHLCMLRMFPERTQLNGFCFYGERNDNG